MCQCILLWIVQPNIDCKNVFYDINLLQLRIDERYESEFVDYAVKKNKYYVDLTKKTF